MKLFGERQTKAALDVPDGKGLPYLESIVLLRLMMRESLQWRLAAFAVFFLMWKIVLLCGSCL